MASLVQLMAPSTDCKISQYLFSASLSFQDYKKIHIMIPMQMQCYAKFSQSCMILNEKKLKINQKTMKVSEERQKD